MFRGLAYRSWPLKRYLFQRDNQATLLPWQHYLKTQASPHWTLPHRKHGTTYVRCCTELLQNPDCEWRDFYCWSLRISVWNTFRNSNPQVDMLQLLLLWWVERKWIWEGFITTVWVGTRRDPSGSTSEHPTSDIDLLHLGVAEHSRYPSRSNRN